MDTQSFEAARAINDAFFTTGTHRDETYEGQPAIDCNIIAGDVKGICRGIIICNDATGSGTEATITLQFRSSVALIPFTLDVNKVYRFSLRRIIGDVGTARSVRILF